MDFRVPLIGLHIYLGAEARGPFVNVKAMEHTGFMWGVSWRWVFLGAVVFR